MRRHYYQDMTDVNPKPKYPHCGCCAAKVILPPPPAFGALFTCECPLLKMTRNGECVKCARCREHCKCR